MKNAGSISLAFVWGIRLRLWAEGDKLRAEGAKLWAEGGKLRAEGGKLWAEGILEAHGNIRVEWVYREGKDSYACKLETGEVFEP